MGSQEIDSVQVLQVNLMRIDAELLRLFLAIVQGHLLGLFGGSKSGLKGVLLIFFQLCGLEAFIASVGVRLEPIQIKVLKDGLES